MYLFFIRNWFQFSRHVSVFLSSLMGNICLHKYLYLTWEVLWLQYLNLRDPISLWISCRSLFTHVKSTQDLKKWQVFIKMNRGILCCYGNMFSSFKKWLLKIVFKKDTSSRQRVHSKLSYSSVNIQSQKTLTGDFFLEWKENDI